MIYKAVFTGTLSTLLATSSLAHQPSQQALEACSGRFSGSFCEIETPGGALNGICRIPPGQGALACVPDRTPDNAQRRPDQENGSERQRPRVREHTVTQSDGIQHIINATQPPVAISTASITIEGAKRVIQANGIPQHNTGSFPNIGNPNPISTQNYEFAIPAYPAVSNSITPLFMNIFGIAVNGVPFDPGAAEWYQGDRNGDWQYEALSGAVSLGIDEGVAHVQPDGAYHYHGIPDLLLKRLKASEDSHSPLVGWAADGFPIYAVYGFQDSLDARSEIIPMTTGYQLKAGQRPMYNDNPGGTYDGTFVTDYEFKGTGTLDKCNGRRTVTPEFPGGIYAYFLTLEWPVIPRCFRGVPSDDFIKQRPTPR